jgi:ABC-type Na+ efflux pump permease subunit
MKTLTIVVVAALVLGMMGILDLRAEEKRRGEGERGEAAVPAGKVSVKDLDAAATLIDVAKKLLADGKKQEAMDTLDEAAKTLAKIKAAVAQPAAAAPAAAAGAGETFKGEVESTHTQKRPRLVVDGTHYELKPSGKAQASVKETLAKISKGEATGRYVVKGAASGNGLAVGSITKE